MRLVRRLKIRLLYFVWALWKSPKPGPSCGSQTETFILNPTSTHVSVRIRACVRAFHSHLAMDCCKHHRLDLRNQNTHNCWLVSLRGNDVTWKERPVHMLHSSILHSSVRAFHFHLAMDCCKHNRLAPSACWWRFRRTLPSCCSHPYCCELHIKVDLRLDC